MLMEIAVAHWKHIGTLAHTGTAQVWANAVSIYLLRQHFGKLVWFIVRDLLSSIC